MTPDQTIQKRRKVLADLGHHYDEQRAESVIDFIETVCITYKGKGAGKPIVLRDWQKAFIREVFGWYDKDGNRVTSSLYLTMGRRNGKSMICACLAAVMLFYEAEPGAEVVLAANSLEQTKNVFLSIYEMCLRSPILKKRCRPKKTVKEIEVPSTSSRLKGIAAEAATTLGQDISCFIYDEISFAKNRDLYDALVTSSGSRENPLHIFITTAGHNLEGIGYEKYKRAKAVATDPSLDPSMLPIIYEVPLNSDHTNPQNWKLGNPALGDYRSLRDMHERLNDCVTEEDHYAFRMYFANQWLTVSSSAAYMDRKQWDACAQPDFDRDILKDIPCFLGLDMSQVDDLTGLAAVWPLPDGKFYVETTSFLPADVVADKERKHGGKYRLWAEQGKMILTPGPSIDYSTVRDKIVEYCTTYDVRMIGYDRAGMPKFASELEKDGYKMVVVRQGPLTLSEPAKSLKRHVLRKEIVHDGNECLSWQFGNTITKRDNNGNITTDKQKSGNKIDAVVALLNAFYCANKAEEPEQKKKAAFKVVGVL